MSAERAGESGTESSIGRNALYSGAQAVGTAVVLFLAYRYLVRNLAPADFGLWALLIAVAGIARLADLGVGAAASRFVALDLGRGAPEEAGQVLQSLALATALVATALAVAVWLASPLILAAVVPASALAGAEQLLPLLLVNLVLTLTGTALLGGLEGAQRFGTRALVMILANVAFLVGCMILTGSHGLVGVGLAQVLQGAVLVGGAWLTVRSVLGLRQWWPRSLSTRQLRRVWQFGAGFQLATAFQLLTELLIKTALAQRAGLPAAGLFEIAQRLVMQLRAPLVAACQVLVPTVAGSGADQSGLTRLYERSCRLLLLATVAAFGALLIAWPLLTTLLLGSFDRDLYVVAAIVTIGWALNAVTAPAYFALLGAGSTAWHVAGHAFTAAVVAAIAFGGSDGTRAPVIVSGYVLALVAGSAFVLFGLHRRLRPDYRRCLPPRLGYGAIAVAVLAAVAVRGVPLAQIPGQWLVTAAALAAFALALWPSWREVGPGVLQTLRVGG